MLLYNYISLFGGPGGEMALRGVLRLIPFNPCLYENRNLNLSSDTV